MALEGLELLRSEIQGLAPARLIGQVTEIGGGVVRASGLSVRAVIGDRVSILRSDGLEVGAEIVALCAQGATLLPDGMSSGIAIGDRIALQGACGIAPHDSWIGRVIDPFGRALDGRPLQRGMAARDLRAAPPVATRRRRLGARLSTGLAVFDTLLPLVQGQRIGLFAGSGVGKSSLLAKLAQGLSADVVVLALVGERGRELREFVETVLGPEGMARSVVIAATSDQSPLVRRRCAWTGMAVAEHFRDQGKQVLFLADSITRFAEAHREVALAAGEPPSLRGFPPSTAHMIMSLAERAGPGPEGAGDITAVFSVLVPGSDMEEPVADILRGVLDGHVVLSRSIAERGRFPAVDLLRSVSRSLPQAASAEENALIAEARRLLGAYDRSEMMIRAGLYAEGSDPVLDQAIHVWPALDAFMARDRQAGVAESFADLAKALEKPPARPAASSHAN